MAGGRGRSGRRAAKPPPDWAPADGGPVCPTDATAKVKAKWKIVTKQLRPGLLRKIDGHELLILCLLLVGVDELGEQLADDPLDTQARRTLLGYSDRVNKLSAMFGLSPADRARMKPADSESIKDELDAWKEAD